MKYRSKASRRISESDLDSAGDPERTSGKKKKKRFSSQGNHHGFCTPLCQAHSYLFITGTSGQTKSEDEISRVYGCATMWHESTEEMGEMLKSIFRIDEDYSARYTNESLFHVHVLFSLISL